MRIQPCRARWKGSISDRERFNNQMHYRPVDRCFNMEFGYWNENFEVWTIFKDNHIKSNAEADIFFNFDRIVNYAGKHEILPPFENKVVEIRGNTKVIQNSDGLLAEVPLDDHDTIPHFIKSTIETPDDWQKCKRERFRLDDPARILDVEKIKQDHPPDRDYPLGIHCGSMIGRVRDMLTFEGLAYACYDYPEMVEDMVETRCRLVEQVLNQFYLTPDL